MKITPAMVRRLPKLTRTDPDGSIWLIGFKRKLRSRKYRDRAGNVRPPIRLKEPRLLQAAPEKEAA